MVAINFFIRKIFSVFPLHVLHRIKMEISFLENLSRGNGEEYFGQFHQDRWIIEDIFKFKKKGFFVDLAANNGIELSNTYVLEKKYNWKGICIDANKEYFSALKKNRNCICINACVDDKFKNVKFTLPKKGIVGGIIDTDTDNRHLVESDNFVIKKTTTLLKILKDNNAPKVIDYLSLDVEGVEERILINFPFDKYKFVAMSVERPSNKLIKYLEEKGYILVGSNFADKLFIHKEINKLKIN